MTPPVDVPTAARAAALKTLRETRRGALADRAFEAAVRDHRLDPRDRAWARELVYGTLRLRGRLDFQLAAVSKRPLDRLDPDILEILRLGAYQLLEMDGVPSYAAVSQAVDMARGAVQSAAGFVNGVLQSLRRTSVASTFPSFEHDPVAHLSTWGSHPLWLVQRWVDRYGADATRRLVLANNTRPELYLRALGPDAAGVPAQLRTHGVETAPLPFSPGSLRVLEGTAVAALDAAPVIVQDPAAGLVVTYIGEPAGVVLDLAAAPGGKAMALAGSGAGGARFVVAADRSAWRLMRVTENIARLSRPAPAGLADLAAAAVVADARAAPFRPVATVLLDAPCTGTGTLRRHPDGRWRVTPEDLVLLGALQRELLDAAAALVEPGGLLVYSTCSLEPEENELQVASFLETHAEFAMESGTDVMVGEVAAGLIAADGTLRVLPQEHGVDGAFAARLRRQS